MSTEKHNVHFLCLEPRETDKCPEIVLKFSKNLVLKFHFLLLGALLMLLICLCMHHPSMHSDFWTLLTISWNISDRFFSKFTALMHFRTKVNALHFGVKRSKFKWNKMSSKLHVSSLFEWHIFPGLSRFGQVPTDLWDHWSRFLQAGCLSCTQSTASEFINDFNFSFINDLITSLEFISVWFTVFRTLKGVSCECFLNLYKTVVKPLLEYANTIWSPWRICDLTRIEKVQM